MATDSLSYSGINRSITDYAGSRACEELINLRPTTEGLVPVRPFTTKFANTIMAKMFVHHTTDGDHYIGIGRDTGNYKVYAHVLGTTLPYLFEKAFTSGTDSEKVAAMDRYIAGLSFAAAGNILLFSVLDAVDSIYENRAFIWKDGAYQETEANVPNIGLEFDDESSLVSATEGVAPFTTESSPHEIVSSVENGLNAIQEKNAELCLGPVIVAIAFKTNDGETFWTSSWEIYDPIKTIGTTNPPYVDATIHTDTRYEDFYDKYGHGYLAGPGAGYGQLNQVDQIQAYGTNVKARLGQLDGDPAHSSYPNYWNKETSMIQSVEVYCSKPKVYLDSNAAYDGLKRDTVASDPYYTLILPQVEYKDMEFADCLLYHQASIPMESLLNGPVEVKLKFGGNIQVTNETLRVDAGAVTRYGKILSYNSRFHYYDSVSMTEVGAPAFSGLHEYAFLSNTTYIFVRHSDESGTRLLYMGSMTGTYGYDYADLTIAPSVNIKEVILYSKFVRNSAAMYREAVCRMTASGAYNFSIGNLGDWRSTDGSGTKAEYEALITANKPPVVETPEPAAINVTEQYNPFVFRVEHSYLAPGNVLDVVPQNYVVTDATYGREPLDVFTESGIYALIQGSGDILYAWFDPIDPMVAFGRAVPTEMGIFFLSGGALYLCAGHRVTLVSDALMAGPHKYVRSAGPNGAYAKIAGGSGVVDMSNFVSAVDFETFAGGGRLSYNRFRQEVIVSSASESYKYSYVLSLKYRQWFKVSERYWQDEPSGTLIFTRGVTSSRMNVLNMETETTGSVKIHLQTRPFSMGYQYAHIHRALSMIRAKLSGTANDVAVLHLYGSDDLQNWTLLAYAKRSGSTTGSGDSITDVPLYISQLRTPTAARSWRYYTVCLTGKVYAGMEDNTDIGPFLVDYEPVVRRIG